MPSNGDIAVRCARKTTVFVRAGRSVGNGAAA